MFGAPPAQDAFGAPPPSSSAGVRSAPASAQLASPPAAIFDPRPQGTFDAPHASPAAEELGSPPASMFDAPPQEGTGNSTAAPFPPSSGTGGARGGDTFGAANDVFGGGLGEPAGATPFGSSPGGVFGGNGEGGEQPSAWWESENGNDDQPDSRVQPEDPAGGGPATGEKESDSASAAVDASEGLGFEGTRTESPRAWSSSGREEEVPRALEPLQGTSPPAPAEAGAEDLGAPPAGMFGSPPPSPPRAEPQTPEPLGRPPRAQAAPSGVADSSAAPSPPRFSSQPPYGVKVDVGDAEGAGAAAGVDAGLSSAGVEVEPWADRTASPGWEKQPSPPLELGVFGAPPEDSVAAVGGAAGLFGATSGAAGEPAEPSESVTAAGGAADLFGASSGAAGESGEGEGDHGGWGMCSADPEGAPPESDTAKSVSETGANDSEPAELVSAAPASASSGQVGVSLQKFSHLSHPPRSSFVANDGTSSAAVAALALGIAPSSPPRLFAERSSSWTERGTAAAAEKVDYEGMFAGTERKGGAGEGERGYEDTDETANSVAGGKTSSPEVGGVPSLPPSTEPDRNSPPSLSLAPPRSSNASSEKYSQGAQPPFSTIPEALDSQSPPRLRGRPQDHPDEEGGAAVEVTSSSSSSSSRARDGSAGPAAATPESGGRVVPGSTLSTPFGALSRGSGTTPRTAEGFPFSEEGRVFDGPPAEGSVSGGKDTPVPPHVVAPSSPSEGGGDGDCGVEEANNGDAAGVVSNPQVVEGKEDAQPRRDAPQAAEGSPSPPPPPPAEGEAARKVDADSAPDDGAGDGWSDDDWGVDDDHDDDADAVCDVGDKGDGEGGQDETDGAGVAAEGSPPGAVESGRESETNLFGSEGSDGDDSWGGGQEEDRGGQAEEGEGEREGEESYSESESDLDSFSDNDLSNEASIAETTASDFFAVR